MELLDNIHPAGDSILDYFPVMSKGDLRNIADTIYNLHKDEILMGPPGVTNCVTRKVVCGNGLEGEQCLPNNNKRLLFIVKGLD